MESGPKFWRIGSPNGWRVRTAATSVAVSDRDGIRLAADPAGPLALGSPDGSLGGLVLPKGMTIDERGRVYLLDPRRARIKRFDAESSAFVDLPSLGGDGTGPREFSRPSAIAIAGRRLYVCDEGNQRVHAFDVETLVLLHLWEADGSRTGWQPVDLATQNGSVDVLDKASARIYRHQGGDELRLIAERPDRAGTWSRVIVDREERIYALNNSNAAYPMLESPDPSVPPVLDAGSIRDRFDAPLIRLDTSNRFCLPARLAQRCGCGSGTVGPPPEIPLASCAPFDAAAPRCKESPRSATHLRTAQGRWLLYVVDREERLVRAFAPGERVRHTWGTRVDWQPVDVDARGETAFILDEQHQAVYRHRAGRDALKEICRAETSRGWSRLAFADSGLLYLYSPGQPVAQAYDCQGRVVGDVDYHTVARLFERRMPAAPAVISGLLFDRQGNRVGQVDWSDEIATPIYQRNGFWQSTPLDSRTYRCQWHRLEMHFADLPPGAKVDVHTYAHETEREVDEVPTERFQHAHTIVAPVQRQSRPSKSGTTIDCLVQSGGGRYLSIRLTLHGDAFSTVAVDTITVHYPRESYLQYLPATFSSDDEGRVFLEQFLAIFQTEWEALEQRITGVERYFDPDAVPGGPFLDYLATQWMGLRLEGDWTAEQKRALLAAAPEIYAAHGQLAGLRKYLTVYLANIANVDPGAVEATGFPVVLEGFRERQHLFASAPETARLGEAAPLWSASVVRRLQLGAFSREGEVELVSTGSPDGDVFDRYAHRFRVMVPACWIRTPDGERMVRRAIEAEKPGQTHYELCLVDARFRLDEQSTVGVDTIIGAPPVITLGGVCDEERAPSLPPSGRLGYDTVLGCDEAHAPVLLAPGTPVWSTSRLA